MESGFMDLSSKPGNKLGIQRDRLSSLPKKLLIRILSLLPTKYAVVMCVLLKKREILPWITSLDFEDSPIGHCIKLPHEIHRFPSFVTFVDSVLQSHKSQCLTSFSLRVGVDSSKRCHSSCILLDEGGTKDGCLPDLKPTQIYQWISFPFTRFGLRQLNLHIFSREPCQVPQEIFLCPTLEVLKLNVNLSFDKVSTFHLPNLKTFHLYASLISEDSFLTNLVSSTPLLEELDVVAWWDHHVQFTTISSPSLRRLSLTMLKLDWEEIDNTDLVLLHTPNLEYLAYNDNLASQYSVTYMASLLKADVTVQEQLGQPMQISCQRFLVFIKALSNVCRLNLFGNCIKVLNYIESSNQLPEFHNLTHLELHDYGFGAWDKVLVAFLYRSPNLETLAFPEVIESISLAHTPEQLEREFMCNTTLADIPWCCRFNLKRIEFRKYTGRERERNLIGFLLRHSLVLEELVVSCFHVQIDDNTTLQNLPRASPICSIQVQ